MTSTGSSTVSLAPSYRAGSPLASRGPDSAYPFKTNHWPSHGRTICVKHQVCVTCNAYFLEGPTSDLPRNRQPHLGTERRLKRMALRPESGRVACTRLQSLLSLSCELHQLTGSYVVVRPRQSLIANEAFFFCEQYGKRNLTLLTCVSGCD